MQKLLPLLPPNMSDRVDLDQVTEYIVTGFIRSVCQSFSKDISILCKSYIGNFFSPHKAHFEWIFQCSNLDEENEWTSPMIKAFGGTFYLKLLESYNELMIRPECSDFPPDWELYLMQQRIKCVETNSQHTKLVVVKDNNFSTECFIIGNKIDFESQNQLTIQVDIVIMRYSVL